MQFMRFWICQYSKNQFLHFQFIQLSQIREFDLVIYEEEEEKILLQCKNFLKWLNYFQKMNQERKLIFRFQQYEL
ncbi:unnamed protein product [Paramecium octaurelia]|uniref:Uncharacterized protein n=1 Tax=Paramecium octaurelia TaxID=43137 RepID=A0A8S1YSK0_PAROT|nr:unnamed protein product [Paramecium octaurelia]